MPEVIDTNTIYDYSDILKTYGLDYFPVDQYWQVGEIKQTQGWILHLSVTSFQVQQLIQLVIPELLTRHLSFRIIRDALTASKLAEGSLGYAVLGKMISIYPEEGLQANALAKFLLKLSDEFQGPAIPTDRHLGGIVYTRYGSFSPVLIKNAYGEWVKHIYDIKGQLIVDPYMIPFRMPDGITWPFGDIVPPDAPKQSKLLNYKYFPLFKLKPDAKGDVIKGLYFKKLWLIRSCLIKEGRANMFADEHGRDIRQRLKWQHRLFEVLHKDIPMPEVFDYFEADGNVYLAMQFIKGKTLSAWISDIYQDRSWHDLSLPQRMQLLDQLLKIVDIIDRIHKHGFVHRDITPENFLLDKKGDVFLIDMELAWDAEQEPLQPPYKLGTPGHMSPEQEMAQMPSFKEDIYALGSMILTFVTNLVAFKITHQAGDQLRRSLEFFSGSPMISQLIASCWDIDPAKRPAIADIKYTLNAFRNDLAKMPKPGSPNIELVHLPDTTTLKRIIQSSLNYLSTPNMLSPKNRWISISQQQETHIGNPQESIDMYEGWHTGMAGPLWLVALAKKMGFSIDSCLTPYISSWEYIEKNYFNHPDRMSPALYGGSAGIALALTEGLNSGLLEANEENLLKLQSCFSLQANTSGISDGIAGQGLALLKCGNWLDKGWSEEVLYIYVDNLIKTQQPDGSWNSYTGVNIGTAGIVYFLLSCLKQKKEDHVEASILRALQWLKQNRIRKDNFYYWPSDTKDRRTTRKYSMLNGNPGICMALMLAYEVMGDESSRKMAEEYLLQLPNHPVMVDLSLSSGLTGLAEVYVEASRIFQDPVWQQRMDWIVQVLLSYSKATSEGSIYWLTNLNEITTADLFAGNSGILHFLIRYVYPEKTLHPLQ